MLPRAAGEIRGPAEEDGDEDDNEDEDEEEEVVGRVVEAAAERDNGAD